LAAGFRNSLPGRLAQKVCAKCLSELETGFH
jgi:hypothetical protein